MDVEWRYTELKWSDITDATRFEQKHPFPVFFVSSRLKGTLVPLAARGQSPFLGWWAIVRGLPAMALS
jgi:hypothetical protein